MSYSKTVPVCVKRSCFITKLCSNKNSLAGIFPKWLEVIAGTNGTVGLMSTFTSSSLQTLGLLAGIILNKQSYSINRISALFSRRLPGNAVLEAQVGLGGQTSALGLSLPADPSFVCPSPSWEPTPVSLLHMCPTWHPITGYPSCIPTFPSSKFTFSSFWALLASQCLMSLRKTSLFGGLEACWFWKAAGNGFPISSPLHSGCSSGWVWGGGLVPAGGPTLGSHRCAGDRQV